MLLVFTVITTTMTKNNNDNNNNDNDNDNDNNNNGLPMLNSHKAWQQEKLSRNRPLMVDCVLWYCCLLVCPRLFVVLLFAVL